MESRHLANTVRVQYLPSSVFVPFWVCHVERRPKGAEPRHLANTVRVTVCARCLGYARHDSLGTQRMAAFEISVSNRIRFLGCRQLRLRGRLWSLKETMLGREELIYFGKAAACSGSLTTIE